MLYRFAEGPIDDAGLLTPLPLLLPGRIFADIIESGLTPPPVVIITLMPFSPRAGRTIDLRQTSSVFRFRVPT